MTQEKIKAIVAAIAGKPVNVGDDDNLFEAGLLDSFGLTDLVGKLEEQFNIRIPDGDLNPRKFESIDRITQYVEDRV